MQPSGNAGQGGRKGPLVAQQHLQGLAMLLRHHLDGDELSLRLFEHQVRCPPTRLCCLAPTGCSAMSEMWQHCDPWTVTVVAAVGLHRFAVDAPTLTRHPGGVELLAACINHMMAGMLHDWACLGPLLWLCLRAAAKLDGGKTWVSTQQCLSATVVQHTLRRLPMTHACPVLPAHSDRPAPLIVLIQGPGFCPELDKADVAAALKLLGSSSPLQCSLATCFKRCSAHLRAALAPVRASLLPAARAVLLVSLPLHSSVDHLKGLFWGLADPAACGLQYCSSSTYSWTCRGLVQASHPPRKFALFFDTSHGALHQGPCCRHVWCVWVYARHQQSGQKALLCSRSLQHHLRPAGCNYLLNPKP